MPFLWKKMKSTRISQLVNDHLQNSQKRRDGSSLLVETGFPTSLIDLFIKNREKLKTPSKKKRRNPPINDANDQLTVGSSVPFAPPPSLAGSLTPTHSLLRCPSPLHNLSVVPSPSPSRCDSGISAVGSSAGVDEKESDDGRGVADVNKVLFGVMKIFLVVVLALGTKRLAVGITISAFLLLFIEYAGRHVLVRRIISRVFSFKEINSDDNNNNGALIIKTKSPDQEVESEIQPVIDEPFFQESESVGKEELVCSLIDSETKKKSKKSKMKSKMKKYVTRKFRSSKKQNDLLRPEVDEFINIGESSISSSSSSSSSSTSWRMQGDEDAIRLSEAVEEANNKGKEVEAGLRWRHLVLCLIVLIGLLGGRAFALLLTLSWFLVLKLGQKFPRFINKG